MLVNLQSELIERPDQFECFFNIQISRIIRNVSYENATAWRRWLFSFPFPFFTQFNCLLLLVMLYLLGELWSSNLHILHVLHGHWLARRIKFHSTFLRALNYWGLLATFLRRESLHRCILLGLLVVTWLEVCIGYERLLLVGMLLLLLKLVELIGERMATMHVYWMFKNDFGIL